MLKKLNTTLLAIVTLGVAGHAVAAEKVDIQKAMTERCAAEVTAAKVADQKTAMKLCECTNNVQAKELTLGEYWQIQSAALSGVNPESISALRRIKPKLDACRKGLKLTKPQRSK